MRKTRSRGTSCRNMLPEHAAGVDENEEAKCEKKSEDKKTKEESEENSRKRKSRDSEKKPESPFKTAKAARPSGCGRSPPFWMKPTPTFFSCWIQKHPILRHVPGKNTATCLQWFANTLHI